MSVTLTQILDNLAAYVQYKLNDGVFQLSMAPERAVLLKSSWSRPVPATRSPAVRATVAQPPPPVAPSSSPRSPVPECSLATETLPSDLSGLAECIAECKKCGLHATRTRTVPGQGNPHPEILFVGEAPGEDEDKQGLSFVGRAGQLLTKMIVAMGLTREEVFIGNILKCRPPENRKPLPLEMVVCMPYLKAQIAVLKPRVIVALGATAAQGLLNTEITITQLRGRWQTFQGIDLMPTYHPAYLLHNPSAKKVVWEDLQAVLRHLNKPIPLVKGT